MREIRQSGSEGGGAEINRPSLPLSVHSSLRRRDFCVSVRSTRASCYIPTVSIAIVRYPLSIRSVLKADHRRCSQ